MSSTPAPHSGKLSDPNCLFCKIASGQIPCHKVCEDEQVLAFLDIGPLSRGHTLIIPKAHYVSIDQMPDDLAAACGSLLPRLSRAIAAATGVAAWNVLQNNGDLAHQAVAHVHFHIIPKATNSGLGISWPAGKLGDQEAGELLAAIRGRL